MTFVGERWKTTVLLAFLLLVAGLACVGPLHAQLKESEVDFEVLAKVVAQKGKDCCLWNMAEEYYGDPFEWNFLKEVNKIPNERRIAIGTVIYIPKKPLEKIAKVTKEEVDEIQKELDLLRKKNKECQDNLKNCEEEKAKLAKQLAACKKAAIPAKKLRDCEAENNKLKAEVKKLGGENRKLGGNLKELEAKNRELARAMKEKDEELEARARRMRREREECEEMLAQKNRHIEELESALKKCHERLEELEAKSKHHPCKEERKHREVHMKPKYDKIESHRSLVAAVAIAVVGSVIWIASDN